MQDGGLVERDGQHENPLVPNKKLRQMYVAMAEARVLDEHIVQVTEKREGSAETGFDSWAGGLPGEHGD